MQKLYSFFFLLLMAVAVISCKDKSEDVTPTTPTTPTTPPTPTEPTTDPDAIMAALVLEGATLKDGTAPSPSNNDVLVLRPLERAITGITNFGITIPLTEREEDQVAGAYFAVKGSNKYFDIPLSALKGERRKAEEDLGISIDLPKDLEPGEFCAEYCIYDTENNVSNVVEVCITVEAFGGEGSEFLTANEWEGVYRQYTYYHNNDKAINTDTLGVWGWSDFYSYEEYCAAVDDYITVNVYAYSDVFYTFNTDGSCEFIMNQARKTYILDENCESNDSLFIDEHSTITETGAWSYNSETQKLTILVENHHYIDRKDGVVTYESNSGNILVGIDVRQENGLVILHDLVWDDVYWLTPKQ